MHIQPTTTRPKYAICMGVIAVLFVTAPVHATYAVRQLVQTPINRLVENLGKQVAAKPKDVKLRQNLARVHAMAYASKLETAQTVQGREDGGVWFGFEPKPIPFAVTPIKDAEKLKIAKAHLEKAIECYREVLHLKPDDLLARLGYAWCLDQAGRDMQAIDEYYNTIKLGWETEGKIEFAPLGGHFIVAEAWKYLKPHLDPRQNAEEIKQMEERIAGLKKLPRFVTPIAIPLEDGLTAADLG